MINEFVNEEEGGCDCEKLPRMCRCRRKRDNRRVRGRKENEGTDEATGLLDNEESENTESTEDAEEAGEDKGQE